MGKKSKKKKKRTSAIPMRNRPVEPEHHEPQVEVQPSPVETHVEQNGRFHWPANKPFPEFYVKLRREPVPCPRCRRVRLYDLSQAAVCTSSGKTAWFRCRQCGYRWEMPVKEI